MNKNKNKIIIGSIIVLVVALLLSFSSFIPKIKLGPDGSGNSCPNPVPECNKCDEDTDYQVVPDSSQNGAGCTLEDGKGGFCKDGSCTEKTCADCFGKDFVDCDKQPKCCNSLYTQCCGGGVCCNKGSLDAGVAKPAGWIPESCGSKAGYTFCIQQCDAATQLSCPGSGGKILCCPKTYPDGRAGACGLDKGFFANIPYCAVKGECKKGETPCKKDECCAVGQTCADVDGNKACSYNKCKQGETLCSGSNKKFGSLAICCGAGTVCYPDGDGWPRCKVLN